MDELNQLSVVVFGLVCVVLTLYLFAWVLLTKLERLKVDIDSLRSCVARERVDVRFCRVTFAPKVTNVKPIVPQDVETMEPGDVHPFTADAFVSR